MRLTEEDKQKIAQMRLDGKSYQKIATELGFSKDTVKSYLRRQGINVLPPVEYEKVMYIYCLQCGAKLLHIEKAKRKKFCCDACRLKWWKAHHEQIQRKKVKRICLYCGKEYEAYGGSPQKYCSTDCYIKNRFKDYTPKTQRHDRPAAVGGEKHTTMPDGCLCASCAWFFDGERHCSGCEATGKNV